MVSSAKTSVTVGSSVNCVKGGRSDPLTVSTTAAPFGTLTVGVANQKIPTTKDAKDPSLGVTSPAGLVTFTTG